MAAIIWIAMWFGIASVAAVIAWAAVQYFVFKDTKEEVIAGLKDLIKGEELD